MNEKVENLILEHLRAIRADMNRMADQMATLRAEMPATRQQVAGIVTLQRNTTTPTLPR